MTETINLAQLIIASSKLIGLRLDHNKHTKPTIVYLSQAITDLGSISSSYIHNDKLRMIHSTCDLIFDATQILIEHDATDVLERRIQYLLEPNVT